MTETERASSGNETDREREENDREVTWLVDGRGCGCGVSSWSFQVTGHTFPRRRSGKVKMAAELEGLGERTEGRVGVGWEVGARLLFSPVVSTQRYCCRKCSSIIS